MKLLVAALLLPLAFAAPAAGADDTVTVTLQVHLLHALAETRDCQATVPAGSSVGDVLDAAVAQGCLESWSSNEYPGSGRYVTCIDGVCEQLGTYWSFLVDGTYSMAGIDATEAVEGATYDFVYDQYLTYLLPVALP